MDKLKSCHSTSTCRSVASLALFLLSTLFLLFLPLQFLSAWRFVVTGSSGDLWESSVNSTDPHALSPKSFMMQYPAFTLSTRHIIIPTFFNSWPVLTNVIQKVVPLKLLKGSYLVAIPYRHCCFLMIQSTCAMQSLDKPHNQAKILYVYLSMYIFVLCP